MSLAAQAMQGERADAPLEALDGRRRILDRAELDHARALAATMLVQHLGVGDGARRREELDKVLVGRGVGQLRVRRAVNMAHMAMHARETLRESETSEPSTHVAHEDLQRGWHRASRTRRHTRECAHRRRTNGEAARSAEADCTAECAAEASTSKAAAPAEPAAEPAATCKTAAPARTWAAHREAVFAHFEDRALELEAVVHRCEAWSSRQRAFSRQETRSDTPMAFCASCGVS